MEFDRKVSCQDFVWFRSEQLFCPLDVLLGIYVVNVVGKAGVVKLWREAAGGLGRSSEKKVIKELGGKEETDDHADLKKLCQLC